MTALIKRGFGPFRSLFLLAAPVFAACGEGGATHFVLVNESDTAVQVGEVSRNAHFGSPWLNVSGDESAGALARSDCVCPCADSSCDRSCSGVEESEAELEPDEEIEASWGGTLWESDYDREGPGRCEREIDVAQEALTADFCWRASGSRACAEETFDFGRDGRVEFHIGADSIPATTELRLENDTGDTVYTGVRPGGGAICGDVARDPWLSMARAGGVSVSLGGGPVTTPPCYDPERELAAPGACTYPQPEEFELAPGEARERTWSGVDPVTEERAGRSCLRPHAVAEGTPLEIEFCWGDSIETEDMGAGHEVVRAIEDVECATLSAEAGDRVELTIE